MYIKVGFLPSSFHKSLIQILAEIVIFIPSVIYVENVLKAKATLKYCMAIFRKHRCQPTNSQMTHLVASPHMQLLVKILFTSNLLFTWL